MMKAKKWILLFFISLGIFLITIGLIVVWMDPFFHYHAPLEGFYYEIDNERYQNDGIMRHFDYDAIISGTSMSENFKTSEFDRLFGVSSIKVPYSGGSLHEISNGINRAFEDHNVKYVIRSLDLGMMCVDKEYIDPKYDAQYLTNDMIFDDIKYLINKDVLVKFCYKMVQRKADGWTPGHTGFDEYANWMEDQRDNDQPEPKEGTAENETRLSREDQNILTENVEWNIGKQAKANPDTQFYLFFPPYSIIYWQNQYVDGKINRQIDIEEETIRLLLEYPNIKLFSFNTETDITEDLDNYTDFIHYKEDINSRILEWMKKGEHLITKENFKEHIEWEREYFGKYNYGRFSVEETKDDDSDGGEK